MPYSDSDFIPYIDLYYKQSRYSLDDLRWGEEFLSSKYQDWRPLTMHHKHVLDCVKTAHHRSQCLERMGFTRFQVIAKGNLATVMSVPEDKGLAIRMYDEPSYYHLSRKPKETHVPITQKKFEYYSGGYTTTTVVQLLPRLHEHVSEKVAQIMDAQIRSQGLEMLDPKPENFMLLRDGTPVVVDPDEIRPGKAGIAAMLAAVESRLLQIQSFNWFNWNPKDLQERQRVGLEHQDWKQRVDENMAREPVAPKRFQKITLPRGIAQQVEEAQACAGDDVKSAALCMDSPLITAVMKSVPMQQVASEKHASPQTRR